MFLLFLYKMRLSSILNDKALRRKVANESLTMMPKDTSNDDEIEFSINADDYVSQEEAEKNVVRNLAGPPSSPQPAVAHSG